MLMTQPSCACKDADATITGQAQGNSENSEYVRRLIKKSA
jgi:hypothetical protein